MTTRISLTLAGIVSRGACVEGTTFFASLSPSEVTDVDWTVDTQITWLRRSARFVSWAMRRGLVPMLPMSEADLREADLRGADLRGADLRWADLRWADLYEANLRGADLRWASLRGADLSGADLRWASLREADLREADLSGAALRGAHLYGAIGLETAIGYTP